MLEAALWGLIGASSLLIGAALGFRFDTPDRIVGLILGFGAGTLVSAVAFELTEEAFLLGGADVVAAGLAAGALTYYAANSKISEEGLLIGAVLDGIPESLVIGITVLEGGGVGVAFLAAVFISNLPESLAYTTDKRREGKDTGHIFLTWGTVVVVAGLSALVGYVTLDGASDNAVGLIQAFAGGAVLTMLADKMFPDAFDKGGNKVGLMTTLGFACAYLLSTLG